MKPRNREVNIFNMSVLDLLTGALGAFCFLTLALFPTYFKSQGASSDAAAAAEQHPKGAKAGLPPFSIESFSTSNGDYPCNGGGGVRIAGVQAPHGRESWVQLPLPGSGVRDGYYGQVYLFMFDPGEYTISVTAYGASSPCDLSFSQVKPKNSKTILGWSGKTPITGGSLSAHPVELKITADQLIAGILPK